MIIQMAKRYLDCEKELLDLVPLDDFERIVQTLCAAWQNESQIFIFGNGGSAATASHFACDINKGVSARDAKRFKVLCLNDNLATMLAYANDQCFEDIFVEQMRNFLRPGDVAIGVSGSGNSANVIKAVEYAGLNGATTVGLTGFDGGRLARIADVAAVIPVNDMQQVEDMHLVFVHMMMQILQKMAGLEPSPAGIEEVPASHNFSDRKSHHCSKFSKLSLPLDR